MDSAKRVRIGQIGYGYWGPNLLRNLLEISRAHVVAVADREEARLAQVERNGLEIDAIGDGYALLARDDIEAVVIATPAHTHSDLAYRALTAGKHVLVEKPLAMSVKEGRRLADMAQQRGLVLMAGHTFLYNAAVVRLKALVDEGELGDVFYLYSQRLNLGRVRRDVNALWNFAPHDISIIINLVGELPVEVVARGFAYLQQGIEDVVFLTLVFPSGVGAHIHISWLDPHRVRRMTIVGSKKMAVYDDASPDAKIVIYDRGMDRIPTADSPRDFASFAEYQLLPRRGDVWVPSFPFEEPLRVECEHFVECILEGRQPLTDGSHGVAVVRVLEAAERSLRDGGRPQAVAG